MDNSFNFNFTKTTKFLLEVDKVNFSKDSISWISKDTAHDIAI